jgi:hypothetical protein
VIKPSARRFPPLPRQDRTRCGGDSDTIAPKYRGRGPRGRGRDQPRGVFLHWRGFAFPPRTGREAESKWAGLISVPGDPIRRSVSGYRRSMAADLRTVAYNRTIMQTGLASLIITGLIVPLAAGATPAASVTPSPTPAPVTAGLPGLQRELQCVKTAIKENRQPPPRYARLRLRGQLHEWRFPSRLRGIAPDRPGPRRRSCFHVLDRNPEAVSPGGCAGTDLYGDGSADAGVLDDGRFLACLRRRIADRTQL